MLTARTMLLATALTLGMCTMSLADSLYGSIKFKDGSKADGSVGVSTSWNGKKGYAKNGMYELDFGEKVGAKVTVYVRGTSVGTVFVSGNTRFDIIVP